MVFIRNDLSELKPAVLTPLIPLKTSLKPLISPSTEMKSILMESAKKVHLWTCAICGFYKKLFEWANIRSWKLLESP